MILIPSIELMDGKVVRLEGGRPEGAKVVADDPVLVARQLLGRGALFFHLVDLDAVFGTGFNDAVFQSFAEEAIPFQVSGGIRGQDRAAELLAFGVDRLVVGSLFFEKPDEASRLVDRFGHRVMAALDAEDGRAVVSGRRECTGHELDEACEILKESGVGSLMYTRVDRDGTLTDPDIEGARKVAETTGLPVFANTGAWREDHLRDLVESGIDGLTGAVVDHHHFPEKQPEKPVPLSC